MSIHRKSRNFNIFQERNKLLSIEERIAKLNSSSSSSSASQSRKNLSLGDLRDLSSSDTDDDEGDEEEEGSRRAGRDANGRHFLVKSLTRLEMLDRSLEADLNRMSLAIESEKLENDKLETEKSKGRQRMTFSRAEHILDLYHRLGGRLT